MRTMKNVAHACTGVALPVATTAMATQKVESVGYSCQFVDALPEELQTECSICLHTVRDPHMVDCCGYRFCRSCIAPILLSYFKKCPLCNCTFSAALPDKLLQRILNQKRVYCVHKDEGCKWIGQLDSLDTHLNADSADRAQGCPSQRLKCTFCYDTYKRCELLEHEAVCPWRPISCEYCNEFSAPQSELNAHWQICDKFPAECENKCGVKITRANMSAHVKDDCPMTKVECEYSYAGCEVKLPRREMAGHVDQAVKEHLEIMKIKISRQQTQIDAWTSLYAELQHDLMIKQIEVDSVDGKISAKDRVIAILKKLCEERDGNCVPEHQVLVTNFDTYVNEHMIRSLFGQFGRMDQVEFYGYRQIAVVEYFDEHSVDRVFHRYNTRGISLRGYQLECFRLSL